MAESGFPQSSSTERRLIKSGWIFGSAHAAGGTRNFKLWVPSTLNMQRACPLVMLLHGCTHTAEDMAEVSGMNEIAEANGFLVAYPEQTRLANPMKCWRWFHPKHQKRDAGEPSILAAVVDKVLCTHNIDRERIYVAGISAGGAMASILAATYPDVFRAVAIAAGTEFKAASSLSEGLAVMKHGGPDPLTQGQLAFEAMSAGLARKNRRRMPVIVFHGTADLRVNPVNADQLVTQWRKTNACLASIFGKNGFSLTERVTEGKVMDGYAYKQHIYAETDGRPLMEKWIIDGLAHAWSGSPRPSKYGDPKGPNASAEIWRFFSQAPSTD